MHVGRDGSEMAVYLQNQKFFCLLAPFSEQEWPLQAR